MNLIEQLGGYEKAKEALIAEQRSKNIDPFIYINGDEVLIDAIDDALLDYRRKHNIFEVGDLVAYRTLPYERLFSVRYVGGDEIVIYELWDEMGAKTFTEMHPYLDIRHATDSEIEAGKRLEVDSE